jgi:hypothetical protein
MNIDAAMTYLEFVANRHKVWEARQAGLRQPWSEDYILRERKFTNVFRVLDPGSQFVLTDLTYDNLTPEDTLMRLFLYRHTGRVEVWQYLDMIGLGYPTIETLSKTLDRFQTYRAQTKKPVFTGAYLVYPQSDTKGTDKVESIIDLTKRLFSRGSKENIMPKFLAAKTQAARFAALRNNKGVADFMSMQVLTDWGYSPYGEDLEDEFVVAGPGALRGAAEIDNRKPALEVIKWAHKELGKLDISIALPSGGTRPPSLMDTQNTLCEFSKYVRYMATPESGKTYKPAHPGAQPDPVLPVHW